MQKAKGDGMPMQSGERNEMLRVIVADLASVIEHVRKSQRLIEQAVGLHRRADTHYRERPAAGEVAPVLAGND